jgi:hypothetical protein
MVNRLSVIAQAANKVKSENNSQKLKFAGIARQAVMLSDREYTSKKDIDTIKPLMF